MSTQTTTAIALVAMGLGGLFVGIEYSGWALAIGLWIAAEEHVL